MRIVSPISKRRHSLLLCYVTDLRAISPPESATPGIAMELASARDALLEKIAAAAAAGVDWIQIREKHLTARECSVLAREALQRVQSQRIASAPRSASARANATALDSAGPSGAPNSLRDAAPTRIFVNDRLDVALGAHADGVHLAENSVLPEEAQRLAHERGRETNFLVGASCHSLETAKAAEQGGADYLFFGPVFATPSKAAYGAPQGLARLAKVCHAVSIPVLAIGGITLENSASCVSTGAAGIAAIRLFQNAPDLPALVRALQA